MDRVLKFKILPLALGLTIIANAQTNKSANYFTSIKNYVLRKLWCADSIQIEGDGEKMGFPEPLGYIGDNFQRFYIHFISITKGKDNPYQYSVYGKSSLFAGSHEAAQRSAMLYSLLGTCKLHILNPSNWLKDILTILPSHPINRIKELLPYNWKITENN
jgi:IS66 C-terminal element